MSAISVGSVRLDVGELHHLGPFLGFVDDKSAEVGYVRPHGALRRAIAKLCEPWIAWAYGAGFDRRTEAYITTAGLQLLESKFVVDDLVKLISVRAQNTE